MTTAFVKIHGFINSLKDDEVIRATDQKLSAAELKKNKNINFDNDKGTIHLYVRSGFFSKLRQVLTSSTDGAIYKQHSAKELIIKTLDNLPDHLKNENSVKNSIKNITDILKNNELKDFTAGMIREDLDVINKAVQFQKGIENPLYESKPVNPLYRGNKNESGHADKSAGATVVADNHPAEGDTELERNRKLDDAVDTVNAELRSITEANPDGDDALSEVGSGLDSDDEDGAVSSSESNLQTQKTDSPSPNLAASIKVAEVVLNSLEPVVNENPAEETTSSPAESAPTINAAPAPIGKAIEQGSDTTEAATENTPSPAPSAPSSTAATKATAKANPYLESLKNNWDPADDGYHTIIKPFFITGGVPTTSMIAQAYLIPAGKKLNFTEEVDVLSSGLDGGVVQAKHILHKHRDTDTQRDTRPYLKLSAKAPNSILVGPSNLTKNSKNKQQMLDKFKADLKNTYLESFKKINEEHKKINSGKQLETLVIVPLSSLPLILSEVESEVLASAVISIQNENQDLKIHISAAETLHENRIRSAYEKILKEST